MEGRLTVVWLRDGIDGSRLVAVIRSISIKNDCYLMRQYAQEINARALDGLEE